MLAFVLETKGDKVGSPLGNRLLKKRRHRIVDVGAIFGDSLYRGARQLAAISSCMTGPGGFVIGVKQKAILGVERHVVVNKMAQHEGFKEPCRVGSMPFCGRAVGHRLHGLVFGGQGRGKFFGGGADAQIVLHHRRMCCGGCWIRSDGRRIHTT